MDVLDRVMPRPWFRAQAFGRPIRTLLQTPERDPLPGERILGPFILPSFQRGAVWTLAQQVRLVESLWSGLPIGAYVHNQTEYTHPCDGWLLDGQQRVTAILAYLTGGFPVFGWRYPDLPRPEQRCFEMMPISALETNLTNEAECRDVYDRLAYGGTAHA